VKDAADVLSFFATQAGTFRFLALLFPGFVAVAVYDLRVPGERRKVGDMGIALVAYSILIDGLSAAYLSAFPISVFNRLARISAETTIVIVVTLCDGRKVGGL
jgi:hypothetical protein